MHDIYRLRPLSVHPQVKMFWRLLTLSLLATACIISASGQEWYKDISASDAITLNLDAQVGPVSRIEKVTKDSVEIQWGLGTNRNRPRTQGYELQYLMLPQGGPNEEAIPNWETVQGQTPTTWVVSTRSNETISDGFFTIRISVLRPPPSRLPSLDVVSEPIPWNSSWQVLTSAIEAPLRESQDPHYSTWTVKVLRCDETEEWDAFGAWVGGCPYKDLGLFTWHLEFKPPDGVDVSVFPPPSLSLAEEDMHRAHVLVERYSKNTMSNNSDDYFQLIDPYFCGGDVCSWWVDDLKPGRSYIFRVRSFNYAGMGDYGPPTSIVTIDIDCPPPTMRTPLFSSASRDYITVSCPSLDLFCQSLSRSSSAERISFYEFQVLNVNGNDNAWTTIGQISPPGDDPIQATWLVVTANNLQPITSYRFRARVLLVDGRVGQWSPSSPPYLTLPPLPNMQDPPEPLPAQHPNAIDVRMRLADDNNIGPTGDCKFVLQSQISGSTRPWVHVATGESGSSDINVTVNGLEPNSRYRFRWQVSNSEGRGEWSLPSVWARTLPTPFISIHEPIAADLLLPFKGSSNWVRILSGDGSAAGNNIDHDYITGTGVGGIGPTHGNPGMAIIRPQTIATLQQHVSSSHTEASIFLSSGEYYVPHDSSIIAVQIKLWGGGGGGTQGNNNKRTHCHISLSIIDDNGSVLLPQEGGGGGYVEALLSVTSGDRLKIDIGSGGRQPSGSRGGLGGEHGGGMGGNGVLGGAGGGGKTSIMRGDDLFAVAGDGGGAGASGGLCCSHGGAGGGHTGLKGLTPENDSLSAANAGGGGGNDTIGGAAGTSDSSAEWGLSAGTRIEQFIPEEENPGDNELQSPVIWDYYVVDGGGTDITQTALVGQFGQGRKGGSGKNGGGGGGGSGYFGGGGGGSAVHGGGGGGGSSFISSKAFLYSEQVACRPPIPTLHFVSDNGATIEWVQPPNITLSIELAVGAISIDFESVVDYSLESTITVNTDRRVYTAHIEGLFPRTEYQVRLVSSSIETFHGMRGGRVLPRGPILLFKTTDSPQNYWSIISPLGQKSGFPAPISGHTLTWGGTSDPKGLWLFGGRSSVQRCDSAVSGSTAMGIDPRGAGRIQQCTFGSGLRSDLWRFDTDTLKWEETAPDGAPDIPSPREGHTTSLIGSDMYVIGGVMTNGTTGPPDIYIDQRENCTALDHYWMVNIAPRIQVENTASDVVPLERGVHSTSAIELGDDELEGKCVSSLRVAVNIQHPCTSQLRIKLWGPDQPRNGMSAVLFNQHNGREDSRCGENITSTWFDDDAPLQVGGCCSKSPFTGFFQPDEPLGKFIGSRVFGNWTLDVFSSPSGDFEGKLIDWTLIISMQPSKLMDEGAMKWERVEVTGGDIPSPRAWHRAIALEESIFVIGGVGGSGIETPLQQSMFRLDIKTSTWVRLAGGNNDHSTLPLLPAEMAWLISPWGLFGFGGRNLPLKRGSETWLLNFVSLQWDTVYTNTSGANMDTWEAGPVGLQRSAAVYVPESSQIYLFGGTHACGISGEMWKLTVNAIVAEHQSTAAAHCGYRMATGGKTDLEWATGCKALLSGGSCTMHTILQHAWCSQAYNALR